MTGAKSVNRRCYFGLIGRLIWRPDCEANSVRLVVRQTVMAYLFTEWYSANCKSNSAESVRPTLYQLIVMGLAQKVSDEFGKLGVINQMS